MGSDGGPILVHKLKTRNKGIMSIIVVTKDFHDFLNRSIHE